MKSKTEIKVRGFHLDMFSHVNNARYLEFLEEARWHAFDESNMCPEVLFERGLAFAIVNININYLFPAGYGDILVIETSLKRMGSKSITFQQNIIKRDDNAEVVNAEVIFVLLDIKTGKAIEITSELKREWFGIDE